MPQLLPEFEHNFIFNVVFGIVFFLISNDPEQKYTYSSIPILRSYIESNVYVFSTFTWILFCLFYLLRDKLESMLYTIPNSF